MPVGGANIRFKADDIWDTPDDGKRYEVIDGALHISSVPPMEHQLRLGHLLYRVAHYVHQHRSGEIVAGPVGVVLGDEDAVQPDIVFISRARHHVIADRGAEGAPDLIVEVLSPDTESRDRGIKMRRYAAGGR
jgi:Uma2 family endonuclease